MLRPLLGIYRTNQRRRRRQTHWLPPSCNTSPSSVSAKNKLFKRPQSFGNAVEQRSPSSRLPQPAQKLHMPARPRLFCSCGWLLRTQSSVLLMVTTGSAFAMSKGQAHQALCALSKGGSLRCVRDQYRNLQMNQQHLALEFQRDLDRNASTRNTVVQF